MPFDFYLDIFNGDYFITLINTESGEYFQGFYDDSDNPSNYINNILGSAELYCDKLDNNFNTYTFIMDEWTWDAIEFYRLYETFTFLGYTTRQSNVEITNTIMDDLNRNYTLHQCFYPSPRLVAKTNIFPQTEQNPQAKQTIVIVPVSIYYIKGPTSGEEKLPEITYYNALLNYQKALPGRDGIYILDIIGIPPFTSPDLIRDAAGNIIAFSDSKTGTEESYPPQIFAYLIIRLPGCALNTYDIEITFESIEGYLSGYPQKIEQETIAVDIYQRGDAKEDGIINIKDSLIIGQYVNCYRQIGEGSLDVRGVNGASPKHDGDNGDRVTIDDADYIAEYLAWLRDCYFDPIGGFAMIPAFPNTTTKGATTVEVDSKRLAAGMINKIPVIIKNVITVNGLGAYQFAVAYDPKVVNIAAIEPGDEPFGKPAAVNIDNSRGLIVFNDFLPVIPGPIGNVTVAYLVLSAIGDSGASSVLDLSIITLCDSNASDITATDVDGQITIK